MGARTWVVLPATSTPQEALAFGQALRRGWLRHRFDEIVVEHGNEHWNAVFRPAGVTDTATLATVADRTFAALREGAGTEPPLHRVLGQGVEPLRQAVAGLAGVAAPTKADTMNLAKLPAVAKAVDVYEANFHTTAGTATSALRNAVLEHPAAGAALMRRLLQGPRWVCNGRRSIQSPVLTPTPTSASW